MSVLDNYGTVKGLLLTVIDVSRTFVVVIFQSQMELYRLTLTLKMTTAPVDETSVTVNNNSPIQVYVHPGNQTQPTFELWY